MPSNIIWNIDSTSFVKVDNRTRDEANAECIDILKRLTTECLTNAGVDQSTQQNAALGIYSQERCEAIKNYIASCRNEYLRCKALILAATTNDEADAVQFVAPEVPEGL
jgi:hypothetical protein